MRKFLIIVVACALALVTATSDALAKRKHVRISKPSLPATMPARDVPLVALPVIGVAFDLARRTSCDPAIAVSTGPGDPGFDPAGPRTGNFLIPAIYSRCATKPQPKRG